MAFPKHNLKRSIPSLPSILAVTFALAWGILVPPLGYSSGRLPGPVSIPLFVCSAIAMACAFACIWTSLKKPWGLGWIIAILAGGYLLIGLTWMVRNAAAI